MTTTTATAPTTRGPLEREFRHAYRTAHGMITMGCSGLAAVGVVVAWVLASHARPEKAWDPHVMLRFAIFLAVAIGFVAMGAGFLKIRTRVYSDRLVVRGMASRGKMRWDEMTAVTLEKTTRVERGNTWVPRTVYAFHAADGRTMRVEGDIKPADEFERIVREKTGLRVTDATATSATPKSEHTHAAFGRKS